MADYTSDTKMAEGHTDGGPYDHEFIIKEEGEETELRRGEEIKYEGSYWDFISKLSNVFLIMVLHVFTAFNFFV